MNYWIDLFTGTTWQEFRAAGSSVSGFSKKKARTIERVQPGDILLCYITGIMRWVGALRVVGSIRDDRKIWHERDFPVRLQVKPELVLKPEEGIPMGQLGGKVSFYADASASRGFCGVLRGSPTLLKDSHDGDVILEMLREQGLHPVSRPVDQKKLEKHLYPVVSRVKGKESTTNVTVPEPPLPDEPHTSSGEVVSPVARKHTEIQYQLMALGSQMNLGLWVARNDRSQSCNGLTLGEMPGVVDRLPTQFNEATQRTIELIDVLWLKNNAIIAAFEVEDTTSVYSGLLRMSDLLALQPNLDISLYLVAPDDRQDKVRQEMLRPTFNLREKPLGRVCGYISYSRLEEKLEGIARLGLGSSLKPSFLDTLAEYYGK
jgi:hypothetical protein